MSQITKPKLKLDFRFADEMDGMDIVQFVNEAYSIEYSGPLSFRKEGSKIETVEVTHFLLRGIPFVLTKKYL